MIVVIRNTGESWAGLGDKGEQKNSIEHAGQWGTEVFLFKYFAS